MKEPREKYYQRQGNAIDGYLTRYTQEQRDAVDRTEDEHKIRLANNILATDPDNVSAQNILKQAQQSLREIEQRGH